MLWSTNSTQVLNLLTPAPPPELSGGEFSIRAKAIKGMALAYLREDEEAETLLKEAADEAARTAPFLQCQVIEFEGYHAWKEKRNELALQRFTEALRLSRQFKQRFMEVGALNGLGLISIIVHRYDEGIERSFSALDLARTSQYHLAEDIALSNLAWGYQELGDLEKAIFYFSQRAKGLDRNEQLKETVLNNMGETQFALGDYPAARASYLKALVIAEQMDRQKRSEEKSRIVATRVNLALIDLEEGNLEEAEADNRQALALDPQSAHGLLISARIAEGRNHLKEAKDLLRKLGEKKVRKKNDNDDDNNSEEFDSQFVRWDAQDELAKIAAVEHQDHHADDQFAKLIQAVEDFRRTVQVAENRLAFSSHAERYYDDYVRFLMESKQPQRAFQVAEFSRARTLEEGVGLKAPVKPADVNVNHIRSLLRQNKRIVLAYWIAPDKSYVWLVSGSRFEPVTLPSGRTIEQAARSYNNTLLGREDAEKLQQQGQELYGFLVKPIQELIPQNAKVVIIPDRELDKLNFETLLPPGPSPHFWIRDVEIQVASSTTMLSGALHRSPKPNRRLLLIGNPLQASNDYPALGHAADEIKKVEGYFPNNKTVISGPQAVPSAYASSHPEEYDVIHFVTHGTASELSPLDSAIILSLDQQSSFKLYARDIVKTRIRANIVTISACYGLGTRSYSGEGLVGLAWAFLQAGAHRVIAGLWEVDELASVGLMDNFYAGIQGGQTPSEALRSAKLKMMDPSSRYGRPLYWAAFQLYMGS